ncbi:MAG: hypothetical protein ABI162_13730 [Luteolibacter sp.]
MSFPTPFPDNYHHHTTMIHDGPAPHEDLTIAEHLETMRLQNENRPGEQCFRNENGEKRWIPDSELERFLHESGAIHPSDYFSMNGRDWREIFFSGN